MSVRPVVVVSNGGNKDLDSMSSVEVSSCGFPLLHDCQEDGSLWTISSSLPPSSSPPSLRPCKSCLASTEDPGRRGCCDAVFGQPLEHDEAALMLQVGSGLAPRSWPSSSAMTFMASRSLLSANLLHILGSERQQMAHLDRTASGGLEDGDGQRSDVSMLPFSLGSVTMVICCKAGIIATMLRMMFCVMR